MSSTERGSVTVRAYAFASTFRLRELASAFEGAEVTLEQDELRITFADQSHAIGFDFGAVVFFDGAEAPREAVVRAITQRFREGQPPRTETFLVEVDPAAEWEVRFDRVVVPEMNWPVRQVVGLLVAQSAAMDYYEDDVNQIIERTEAITKQLAAHGRMRGQVRSLVRFIGHCIETKNEVVSTLALFDKPESTWEQEALDRLFVRLRKMLEIDDRFRTLEYRLRMIQESLVLLVDLSRGQSTYRLEVLVVLLILLELGVMIFQIFRGH